MRIVVDTNIVFSALLNSKGRIGQLIITGARHFDFFTSELLTEEISRHRPKLLRLSGLDEVQMESSQRQLFSRITFVDAATISDNALDKAENLTRDIDPDDVMFVALAEHLRAKLWTGDKVLLDGLRIKGYPRTVTTQELYDVFLLKRVVQSQKKRR
jgi:predicted nucleic acid-binding protein